MNIEAILAPERARVDIEAKSMKRALENVALVLAKSIEEIDAEDVFTRLINREKMGSTAIGHGIAIPHCRLDNCSGIYGGIFKLKEPVDFQAPDREPVHLLFVLLVPGEETEEHLRVLASLAKRFDTTQYRANLDNAETDDALWQAVIAELPDSASYVASTKPARQG